MACFDVPGDAVLANDGSTLLLVTGQLRLKQRLITGFNTIAGSYRYNRNVGFPWFSGLLDRGSEQSLTAEMQKFILEQPEVVRIRRFKLDVNRNTRRAAIEFDIQTTDDETLELTAPLPLVATT